MSVNTWPAWATLGARVILVDGLNSVDGHDKPHLEGQVFIIIEKSDAFGEPAVRTRNAETGDENDPWTFGRLSRYRPVQSTAKPVSMEEDLALFERIAEEVNQPLTTLTDALNLAWLAYGVEE